MKKGAIEKEVPKKTSVTLLLIAIILAITMTMYILNFVQSSKVTKVDAKDSSSSGEISFMLNKPPIVKDESQGSVSLNVLPPGG